MRSSKLDKALEAELEDHLERVVADHVAAGMDEAEARRRARLEFGGVQQVKELCRDVHRVRWVDETLQDVRYAVRRCRKVEARHLP